MKEREYPLNSDHKDEYLFRYQIRTDSGHVYDELCYELELVKACEGVKYYERGKKVFTPAEFIEEMQKDPHWEDYIKTLNEN